MKYFVLALLLFLLGLLISTFEPPPERYHPVARIRTADGFFMTFVQDRVDGAKLCREALDAFVETLGKTCPSCDIESKECAAALRGIDKALAEGGKLPIYRVRAPGIGIALIGPPAKVRARCEHMATGFVARGMQSASCVFPNPG